MPLGKDLRRNADDSTGVFGAECRMLVRRQLKLTDDGDNRRVRLLPFVRSHMLTNAITHLVGSKGDLLLKYLHINLVSIPVLTAPMSDVPRHTL